MTGSDILDNFSDVVARVSSLSDEEAADLSSTLIAEIVAREGNLTDHQVGNFKSLFASLAQNQAKLLWSTVLSSSTESKRVAMAWQHDQAFCDLLRTIHGMPSKLASAETTISQSE